MNSKTKQLGAASAPTGDEPQHVGKLQGTESASLLRINPHPEGSEEAYLHDMFPIWEAEDLADQSAGVQVSYIKAEKRLNFGSFNQSDLPFCQRQDVVHDTDKGRLYYAFIFWNPDLKILADRHGDEVWGNTLRYYSMLNDGVWVKEVSNAVLAGYAVDDAAELADAETEEDAAEEGEKGEKSEKKRKGPRKPRWERITSTPVMVDNMVVNEHNKYFFSFRFYAVGNGKNIKPHWIEKIIANSQLVEDRSGVWADLANDGLMLARNGRRKFHDLVDNFYQLCQSKPHLIIGGRSTPGWYLSHSVDGGPSTWHYIAAGFKTDDTTRYTGSSKSPWTRTGSAFEYKKRLSEILIKNPVVALTCGFHAASLILRFLPQVDHNPIWAHLGASSTGKSLAAQTALSMRCNPVRHLETMDATEGALKSRMRIYNQTGGVLDEIGSSNMRLDQKIQLVYNLAAGQERGRNHQNSETGEWAEKTAPERAYFTLLLTGEVLLLMPEDSHGGNAARLTQNVFSETNPLWHSITNKDQAEEWRGFIANNHGHLYPELVRLVQNDMARYEKFYKEFSADLAPRVKGNVQGRKTNAWALALTGVMMLADALYRIEEFEDEDSYSEGFTHQHIGHVHKHAVRLMLLEMDNITVTSDEEKYFDVLNNLYHDNSQHFFYHEMKRAGVGEALTLPTRNAVGAYILNASKETQHSHELRITKAGLQSLCAARGNIDMTRFLQWAKEAGYLQPGGTPKDPRLTKKIPIDLRHAAQVNAYVFKWTDEKTDTGKKESEPANDAIARVMKNAPVITADLFSSPVVGDNNAAAC